MIALLVSGARLAVREHRGELAALALVIAVAIFSASTYPWIVTGLLAGMTLGYWFLSLRLQRDLDTIAARAAMLADIVRRDYGTDLVDVAIVRAQQRPQPPRRPNVTERRDWSWPTFVLLAVTAVASMVVMYGPDRAAADDHGIVVDCATVRVWDVLGLGDVTVTRTAGDTTYRPGNALTVPLTNDTGTVTRVTTARSTYTVTPPANCTTTTTATTTTAVPVSSTSTPQPAEAPPTPATTAGPAPTTSTTAPGPGVPAPPGPGATSTPPLPAAPPAAPVVATPSFTG